MFHKLETAEEPCGAGMLEWTEGDQTITLHATLETVSENDK